MIYNFPEFGWSEVKNIGRLAKGLVFTRILIVVDEGVERVSSIINVKVLALILITLSILLLPVFIFLFVISIAYSLISILDFYYVQSFAKGLRAFALIICSVGLFFLNKYLIKWLNE